MDQKTTEAWHAVRGYLAAAGAFLLLNFLLPSISFGRMVDVELFVLPLALGFVMGMLVGPRWYRPVRASVLLRATLVVAYTIPYTVETIAMVSDESIARTIREDPRGRAFAGETRPSFAAWRSGAGSSRSWRSV